MVYLTVWVRCHTNPSLGIIQAVTSDIRRKRVRDHVKKATAVQIGNSLRNMREMTKGHSVKYSGNKVN